MKLASLLLASVLAVSLSACDEPQDQAETKDLIRPAKVATAKNSLFETKKIFPGITEATKRSTLAFRVPGQITELPIVSAQHLKKGDLIASLDDAPYQATLKDRQAKFNVARTNLNRQKQLHAKKYVSQAKLDEARSSYQAASAALKLAKDELSYTRLLAPYDGVVSRIDVDNFQNVQAKEQIVQFQGAKNIDIAFNVPESLFLKLNGDNTQDGHVIVRFDSLPDRQFDAWYREHDSVPDATTRSFKVIVSMPRPKDLTVLPGMTASVEVDLSQVLNADQKEGILLPLEAVFEEGGKSWVWKLTAENAAQKTEVTAIGLEGSSIRLSSGLTDGDRVIAAGVSHVREGQIIRPIVKERGL